MRGPQGEKKYIVYAGKTLVIIPKARICAALALKTHYCFKHLHPIQKTLACCGKMITNLMSCAVCILIEFPDK